MKYLIVYLFAIMNASIIGFSFLFTKTAITLSSPLDTLAFRFTISFFVISLFVIFKFTKIDLSFHALKRLAPIGLFYPIIFFSSQAYGLNYSQSSEAGILFASIPILTTILASYFLKESTTLKQSFLFSFLCLESYLFSS